MVGVRKMEFFLFVYQVVCICQINDPCSLGIEKAENIITKICQINYSRFGLTSYFRCFRRHMMSHVMALWIFLRNFTKIKLRIFIAIIPQPLLL